MVRTIGKDVMMDRRILVNTFNFFKQEPLKIFVVKDFAKCDGSRFKSKYLNTLISLGLIEKVDVIYKCGLNLNSKNYINGFKLNRKLFKF